MNTKEKAPICLFVYNRPEHTRRTVDALRSNIFADESDLIIFADGPKSDEQAAKVSEVRQYIKGIKGFKSVSINEHETNLGLANSVINGVSLVVNKFGRIIVLEDDLLTSPYFLSYMNDALDLYETVEKVVSVHGYVYPVNEHLPETFLLPGADCWGWATWSRGWDCFNSDGQFLRDELRRRELEHVFDYNGSYPFVEMLEGQVNGENDSWAIRWYASAFLLEKLTLYPGRSLVENIGNDSSGTHCEESSAFNVRLSDGPIILDRVKIESSYMGMKAFEKYFKRICTGNIGPLRRLLRKIQRYFNHL